MGQAPSSPIKQKSQRSKIIHELKHSTSMSVAELKAWYEKFMQDNPTGRICQDDFIKAYEDSSPNCSEACRDFAERIFNAYDMDGNGYIDVKEFLVTVNIASKGTASQKLDWAFDLYDQDRDDYITREEAEGIIHAIYEMEGNPDPAEKAAETTAELFDKIDRNDDDRLSREEFLDGAKSVQVLSKLLPGC